MPNQSQSGVHIAPFHTCDRCGWVWRVTNLQWQNGLLLCQDCWDNPIAWERPVIIQEVLSESPDMGEAGTAEILKGNQNEPEPPQI